MPTFGEYVRNDGTILVFELPKSRGRPPVPLENRWATKVAPPNEQECKLWTGAVTYRNTHWDKYYLGRITDQYGHTKQAHIIMWEIAYGIYPERQIRPLCQGKWLCMNKDHWEMVEDRNSKATKEEIKYWAALKAEVWERHTEEYRQKRKQAGFARKEKRSRKGKGHWWGRKKQNPSLPSS